MSPFSRVRPLVRRITGFPKNRYSSGCDFFCRKYSFRSLANVLISPPSRLGLFFPVRDPPPPGRVFEDDTSPYLPFPFFLGKKSQSVLLHVQKFSPRNFSEKYFSTCFQQSLAAHCNFFFFSWMFLEPFFSFWGPVVSLLQNGFFFHRPAVCCGKGRAPLLSFFFFFRDILHLFFPWRPGGVEAQILLPYGNPPQTGYSSPLRKGPPPPAGHLPTDRRPPPR